ncbi:putative phage tail protein [Paenibacillus sp. y28]|uniref:putative phage tail protein n=1 Tax=Paenibacillus sp. y28 TaxID=3129110 RepID=UPI0030169EB8
MSTKLQRYLPDFYNGIAEFELLTGTEDMELDLLKQAIGQWLDDQFVMTAGEQALKRREQQLQIRADVSTETLEFRRKRLINRYSAKPPFTKRYLQQRLDYLLGPGKAEVDVDGDEFILRITISVPDAAVFKEIAFMIQTTKPANMIYNQATSLEDRIGIEEHLWKTPLIRATLLGSWQLGRVPFAIRGQEVQIG